MLGYENRKKNQNVNEQYNFVGAEKQNYFLETISLVWICVTD
jgi:hypothetical protein